VSVKPIGIIGGTFDPVHNGHLRAALECVQAADLEQVLLIPLYDPPHPKTVYATAEQRLRMLQTAIAGVNGLAVDTLEIDRRGKSYTIDTVKELRDRYGDRPLCLIMGMDAFCSLHTWKQWDLIQEYVHIIVTNRPENTPDNASQQIHDLYTSRLTDSAGDLHVSPAGRIFRIELPLLAISSSRIRKLFADGGNPAFLLPENVLRLIRKDNIYRRT